MATLPRQRGKAAIEAVNIIPLYGGVIINDCWSSYLSYHGCGHALCGSHLLRELTFIKDAHNYAWARNMKRLLQETCNKVSVRTEKRLSDKELANLQKRYRNILTRGEKELPIIPPRPSGKRGKLAKSDAHNLWQRLKNMRSRFYCLPKTRMYHLPITGQKEIREWQRLNKKFLVVSGQVNMHMHIVEFQAICNQWPTRDITHLSPYKLLWQVELMKYGVSSYFVCLISIRLLHCLVCLIRIIFNFFLVNIQPYR